MHAWQVTQLGHYNEALSFSERADPACPEDGVVIEVAAAAVNFPDLLSIAGLYQVKHELPFVPGLEAVGTVIAAGERSRFERGQRVIVNGTSGAFAEKMAASDSNVFEAPASLPDDHAAGLLIAYQTSYFGLVIRAALTAGEILLVHGGAGGVGTSAIQIGKHLGARVIATASTAAKLEHCKRAGADEVINYTTEDFGKRVKELTGGHGADVIYDPVGGDVTVASTKCIAWNGRLLIIGFASGTIPSIPANRILLKNISVVGLHWGNYFVHEPERVREAHSELLTWHRDGAIAPIIGGTFPMSELPRALAAVETRKALGKLIVTR